MATRLQEFCENCEGEALDRPFRLVRRDPALADNKRLPKRLQLEVGRTVYAKLREGFRGSEYACPAPLGPEASASEVRAGVETIMGTFRSNGFLINAKLSDLEAGSGGAMSWTLRTEGAANLWGLQALQARRSLITDAFDAFAVLGFLDASGLEGTFSVDANDTYAEQQWTVRRKALVV